MVNKKLSSITFEDVEALKTNAVRENKTIEYKKVFYSDGDSDVKDFLGDISSFANTIGGDYIVGIEAADGVPVAIEGVEVENIDAFKLKLEGRIQNGFDPRIKFSVQEVGVKDKPNYYVFVFRIEKSWIGPHRVTYKGHDKFYARNSGGRYPLDTSELRLAFNLSATLTERIGRFRKERLSFIETNNLSLPMTSEPKVVLHIIPLEAFQPESFVDISILQEATKNLGPMNAFRGNSRINLDGILIHSALGSGEVNSYTQLYRNGIIEVVAGSFTGVDPSGKKYIASELYEATIIRQLKELLEILQSLGINMPVVIFLSLLGVRGYMMPQDFMTAFDGSSIDRDNLELPEVFLESYNSDPVSFMRPTFDLVWNSCGFKGSRNYNEKGEWIKEKIF